MFFSYALQYNSEFHYLYFSAKISRATRALLANSAFVTWSYHVSRMVNLLYDVEFLSIVYQTRPNSRFFSRMENKEIKRYVGNIVFQNSYTTALCGAF